MANLTTTDAVIVELFDNPLTERPDDRFGRVINIASINEDTLISRAIAGGFNGNPESMKAAYLAMKHEAMKALVRGEIVNFGLGHVVLDVEGVFLGNSPQWNPEKHKLVASITPEKDLRETLKTTPVNVIGMAPDRMAIEQITDLSTGKTDGTVTAGLNAEIKGTYIKVTGTDPTCGIYLSGNPVLQTDYKFPASHISVNDPSKVIVVLPADLPKGKYSLRVTTQFSANKQLKQPRTATLPIPLIVI
ncbi:MAG: DUF4469 domain-containing protein [Prevotellaceae bacterium]|jgi:hypothetical protein|nr:DUF4469 domain-containing protein [Prevotellaceae bacterium]